MPAGDAVVTPHADGRGAKAALRSNRQRAAQGVDHVARIDDGLLAHNEHVNSSSLNVSSVGFRHDECARPPGHNRGMDKTLYARQPSSVEIIAARLKQTRLALGFAVQAEYCTKAGVEPPTYNQWETGKGRPSLDGAMKLCQAYNLTLDWIYYGDPRGLPYDVASRVLRAA